MADNSTELGHGLQTRHITMMGLGSAIGAGLFLGTGVGIKLAGPAILVSYAIAGFIVVCVMRMLGEMSAAHPASGSFAAYVRLAFGRHAGFTIGWLFWFQLIVVMAAEIVGVGSIVGAWFDVEGWIPSLIFVTLFTIVNMMAVRGFGEFEYWFSLIKITVILIFLVIGVALIMGWLPGHSFIGLSEIEKSGFMPKGVNGILIGLLAVIFSFGGTEIVAIAAAESENPEKAIASAVRSVVYRIAIFYIGTVAVIVCVLPYSQIQDADNAAESPFTKVLAIAGIPGIVEIMEIVIVLSLLSAFNAQVFASSRMLYSMSVQRDALPFFLKLSPQKVPQRAVAMSMVMAYAAVLIQAWSSDNIIEVFLQIVGTTLLIMWITTAASELKLRPQFSKLPLKMWLYPWLSIFILVVLLAITVAMAFDPATRIQVGSVLVIMMILCTISWLLRGRLNKPTYNHIPEDSVTPSETLVTDEVDEVLS